MTTYNLVMGNNFNLLYATCLIAYVVRTVPVYDL
jgi:hypothetical protein